MLPIADLSRHSLGEAGLRLFFFQVPNPQSLVPVLSLFSHCVRDINRLIRSLMGGWVLKMDSALFSNLLIG